MASHGWIRSRCCRRTPPFWHLRLPRSHSVGDSQHHSCWIVSLNISSDKDAWTSHTSIMLIYTVPCNYNQHMNSMRRKP